MEGSMLMSRTYANGQAPHNIVGRCLSDDNRCKISLG
jgi:hypothetical protein